MLVIFYIVSALSAIFAGKFLRRGTFKQWAVSILITFITGTAFCLVTIQQIASDIRHVDFWSIFKIASLIVLQLAFIFNDVENLLNYEIVAILFAFTVDIILLVLFPSTTWVTCHTDHISTEIVSILTSTDDTGLQISVYGNGYIVKKINGLSSNKSVYQYYYMQKNGTPEEGKIPAKSTTICYIEKDESPYLEIITTRHCSGYDRETQKHILTTESKIYILYIPEGSVLNVIQSNKN